MNGHTQDQPHGDLIQRLRKAAYASDLSMTDSTLVRDAIEALAALPKPQIVQAGERESLELPDDGELESWRAAADDLLRCSGEGWNGPTVRSAAFKLQNAYDFGRKARAALPATTAPEAQEVGVRYVLLGKVKRMRLLTELHPEDLQTIRRVEAFLATPQTEPAPASAQVAQLPTQAPQPTKAYCCYGMYADVGHDDDCPVRATPAAPVAIDAQATPTPGDKA